MNSDWDMPESGGWGWLGVVALFGGGFARNSAWDGTLKGMEPNVGSGETPVW